MLAATASHPLPQPFHALEPFLNHYGYLAVAVILVLENLGIPFPGETILIAAALYAGTGRLNIWIVIVVAVVASIAGALLGYLIGSTGGRALLERYGRYVRLTPARLDRLEGFVNRRGIPLIIVGRFIEGVRQFSGLIAGFSDMTAKRFAFATTVGAVLWVAFWASLGYFAGNHVSAISRYATEVAIAVLVLIVAVVIYRVVQHRRRTAD